MPMKTRHACVAGRFYPSWPAETDRLLESVFKKEKKKIKYELSGKTIAGGVVPHAGIIYSGYQAVHFFELIRVSGIDFETVVIIHPNHTGYGSPVSVDSNDYWETPDGNIPVDTQFVQSMGLKISGEAHLLEHSCEVMLPFLTRFMPRPFKIVPVSMLVQSPITAKMVAKGMLDAVAETNRKILVIASSDFSHYVSPELGQIQDNYILAKIHAIDVDGVYYEVRKHKVSVCGYGPIMALMEYLRMITDVPEVHLLSRGHSGEVHDSKEVVDYVSMLFTA